MKLKKYLEKHSISHKLFREKLGLDKATFSRYINGVRKIPLCIAVKIERLTKGEVQCRHLV